MKIYFGMLAKSITVIVAAMLLSTTVLTVLFVEQEEARFLKTQQDKTQAISAQYEQLTTMAHAKIEMWIAAMHSFTDFGLSDGQLTKYLVSQSDFSLVNINHVWVHDENNEILLSNIDSTLPDLMSFVLKVRETMNPEYHIYCEAMCWHLVTVPVLVEEDKIYILTVSSEIAELLHALSNSFDAELAVFKSDAKTTNIAEDLNSAVIVSNQQVLAEALPFIQNFSAQELAELRLKGITIVTDKRVYWANLMRLESEIQHSYIMLFEDITDYYQQAQAQRNLLIAVAIITFIILTIVIYIVFRSSSRRLLNLASYLPFLAEKRFHEFRKFEQKRSTWFVDELDVVSDATVELSQQLEALQSSNDKSERELKRVAMVDEITGMSNRNMFNFQLNENLVSMKHHTRMVAVLFCGVDDFKKINDRFGYHIGDKILHEVGSRIRYAIDENASAFRFSGDEFTVILPFVASEQDIAAYADRILQSFSMPISIGNENFNISVSIGTVSTKSSSLTSEALASQAAMAMHDAKKNGRSSVSVFDDNMYQKMVRKVQIESEILHAIEANQFTLDLQPKVEIATGRLKSFEALIRWHHPEFGLVPPNDFIPVLESSNHMIALGNWVIDSGGRLLKLLDDNGYNDVSIAINLSADQFTDPNLLKQLNAMVERYGISPSRFEMELTERSIVEDVKLTIDTMSALKAAGFCLSIDDFGTGYSSLSYLKEMPVDCIKIDRSFISSMLEDKAGLEIVLSTMSMAHNIGMYVVAEGVETRAELDFLKRNECELVQGYFLSRPIPEKELFKVLGTLFPNKVWRDHVND